MTITRTRRAALVAALAELADGCTSAADVARKLAEAGCQGIPDDCYDCPISVWLLRRLPGPHLTVIVTRTEATAMWESPGTYDDPKVLPVYETDVTVPMPAPLPTFVVGFDDRREFAELSSNPAQGEYFEVCATSPAAHPAFCEKLDHDRAHQLARMASCGDGRPHRVDRVTVVSGETRRNRIAEYRNGERIF